MDIEIKSGVLNGEVNVISSKSHAHRLFIAAALAKETTTIHLNGWSEDMEATKLCLEAMGTTILHEGSSLKIIPYMEEVVENVILDCNESGSTVRFLLPLAATKNYSIQVIGRGRLPERPLDVLLLEMRKNGAVIDGEKLPLRIMGGLQSGIYTMPANISSQYITGLLFALPLLMGDSEIRLTTEMESRGYIDMTLETLRLFGISIEETEYGFFVKGNQEYCSPKEIMVEGDWSGAAFWCVAGACGKKVFSKGLRKNSTQGDREIVSLLEAFGAEINWKKNGVSISPNINKSLQAIRIDAKQIPDLVPILCVVAAMAGGTTEIYNAGRLRIKESDRLQAMAEGLLRMGVAVEEKEDGILVTGGVKPPSDVVRINGYNDHRIVMSFAILASLLQASVVIEGAEAVAKSYPNFFEEFVKLGGVANVI